MVAAGVGGVRLSVAASGPGAAADKPAVSGGCGIDLMVERAAGDAANRPHGASKPREHCENGAFPQPTCVTTCRLCYPL